MSADSMWQVVLHLVLLSQLRPLSLQAELESALAGKRKADEENRQLQLGLLQHQKVLVCGRAEAALNPDPVCCRLSSQAGAGFAGKLARRGDFSARS